MLKVISKMKFSVSNIGFIYILICNDIEIRPKGFILSANHNDLVSLSPTGGRLSTGVGRRLITPTRIACSKKEAVRHEIVDKSWHDHLTE